MLTNYCYKILSISPIKRPAIAKECDVQFVEDWSYSNNKRYAFICYVVSWLQDLTYVIGK